MKQYKKAGDEVIYNVLGSRFFLDIPAQSFRNFSTLSTTRQHIDWQTAIKR